MREGRAKRAYHELRCLLFVAKYEKVFPIEPWCADTQDDERINVGCEVFELSAQVSVQLIVFSIDCLN